VLGVSVVASQRFTRALINLAARGLRTHCSDPGTSWLWLSEVEADVLRLRGCAAAVLCWCRLGRLLWRVGSGLGFGVVGTVLGGLGGLLMMVIGSWT
jgi:hypothetical protein